MMLGDGMLEKPSGGIGALPTSTVGRSWVREMAWPAVPEERCSLVTGKDTRGEDLVVAECGADGEETFVAGRKGNVNLTRDVCLSFMNIVLHFDVRSDYVQLA
jgi:hypothetical protein